MDYETDVVCYKWIHLAYIFGLSLPFIIVYVIGVPAFQFGIMCRYRKQIENKDNLPYYGFLFKGLKPKFFYWENIEQFYKISLIILVKFMTGEV